MPIIEQKTPKSTYERRDTNMEIRPFQAFRFDPAVVGDVGSCTAPPFDVISTPQQQKLYERNEHNIVRIVKGKTTPSDDGGNNQYTRAAEYFKRWVEEGALKQDPTEAIYAYVQDFQLAGATFQRLNFIALAKLEDFGPPGRVRPHEQILQEPMIDRLKLKRATAARFGLVFMLYEDDGKIADKVIQKAATLSPLIDFVDDENVRHRIFAITAKEDIDAIAAMMNDKTCVIADGHHRYTTGLNYSKESSDPAAKYQMLAFSNTCQDGLRVLATHRLVGNVNDFDMEKLLTSLKENFELAQLPFDSPTAQAQAKEKMLEQMRLAHDQDKASFGIYGGNHCFFVAVLKDQRAMDSAVPNKSAAWRKLDTAVLQKLVLEKVLRIDETKLVKGEYLEYVKDSPAAIDDSISQIDAGRKQVVFFMNPVKMQQLKMVTDAGERMPPKSTYFFPKMYTGLTIQKL